jgi:hypothetical protein
MTSSGLRTKVTTNLLIGCPMTPTHYKPVQKYPDVEDIEWSKDCPSNYVRGKKIPTKPSHGENAIWNEKVP